MSDRYERLGDLRYVPYDGDGSFSWPLDVDKCLACGCLVDHDFLENHDDLHGSPCTCGAVKIPWGSEPGATRVVDGVRHQSDGTHCYRCDGER